MINGYTLGNLTRTVAYEANRNLVNTVTNTWNASTISAFDYTNDAAGRRTNREDSGSAFASTLTNTFGYNSKSEVTSANMRNGTSSYTFDQIGNRIQVSVPDEPNPLDYTTNALNQYEETGAPTLLSAYDLDGNLTNDGKGTTFEWNAENRMVRVTTPTKVIENTFDAQGRRVRKQVFTSDLSTLTSDTRYFYDGWNLIYEDDVLSSTDTKYYVWGLDLSQSLQGAGGIGGLLLVKQGTTTWAPTYDANGNISEYIDLATGNETAHLEYDAFGRKIVATGNAPSTFGFSTKYEDIETGYLYYGFRFYDPQTGRWPNRDPIGEWGGVNLFVVLNNNVLIYIDVLGLACCEMPDGMHGPPQQYDENSQCCINGGVFPKTERVTVKLCRRPANFTGGGLLSKVGLYHQFIVGPDGPPVGQGPTGTDGNPGPALPGVQTELTDHSKELQNDCIFVEVNRCKLFENTRLNTPRGRWAPGCNDCNTTADDILNFSDRSFTPEQKEFLKLLEGPPVEQVQISISYGAY
jgi:RHS repeat-associated protein